MADRAAAAGRRTARAGGGRGRRRGPPLVQLPRVPRDHVRSQLSRRGRHADQLEAGRARGALHPRALRSPGARLRRGPRRTWPTTRPRSWRTARPVVHRARGARRGWTTLAELRAGATAPPHAAPTDVRRRPPSDVHVRHDRTPQGRDDHPRQPGVEEPGAHRRVRVHRRRPRPGLRAAVPRRRARPHDDLAHRGRRHDHHPPGLRRRGGGRRAGAVAGDHGLAGAGHGQRDHGPARRGTARPRPRCA